MSEQEAREKERRDQERLERENEKALFGSGGTDTNQSRLVLETAFNSWNYINTHY